MYRLILSKRKRQYLMTCGIEPIDGFEDYYQENEQLRQALETYDILACGFKNFLDACG